MEAFLLGPRAVDDLGRVVIPLEVRVLLGLSPGAKVVFAVEAGRILLIRQDEASKEQE